MKINIKQINNIKIKNTKDKRALTLGELILGKAKPTQEIGKRLHKLYLMEPNFIGKQLNKIKGYNITKEGYTIENELKLSQPQLKKYVKLLQEYEDSLPKHLKEYDTKGLPKWKREGFAFLDILKYFGVKETMLKLARYFNYNITNKRYWETKQSYVEEWGPHYKAFKDLVYNKNNLSKQVKLWETMLKGDSPSQYANAMIIALYHPHITKAYLIAKTKTFRENKIGLLNLRVRSGWEHYPEGEGE